MTHSPDYIAGYKAALEAAAKIAKRWKLLISDDGSQEYADMHKITLVVGADIAAAILALPVPEMK